MRASWLAGELLKLRVKARGAAVRNVLANIVAVVREFIWVEEGALVVRGGWTVVVVVGLFGVAGGDDKVRSRVAARKSGARSPSVISLKALADHCFDSSITTAVEPLDQLPRHC